MMVGGVSFLRAATRVILAVRANNNLIPTSEVLFFACRAFAVFVNISFLFLFKKIIRIVYS
jgi:hypothetical protein